MIRQIPQIPMQFYGRVWIDGALASAGQEVRAVVEGTIFSQTDLTDSQGRYGWDISNLFKLGTGNTDCSGRTVIFYVNGVESVRVSFEHGGIMQLDLQGGPSGFVHGSIHVARIALRNPTGTAWNYQVNLLIGSTTVMTKTQQIVGGATVQIEGNVTIPSILGTFAVTAHVIEANLGVDLGSFNLGTVTII